LILAPIAARAEYPEKAIVLLVPFPAGGPSDKIARDLAEAISKPLGQTLIVENVAGAGGTLGTSRLARSNPDGYTLLIHHIGLATAPALYKNPGFKTGELEFLGLINEAPSTLIGKPTLAADTLADLRKTITADGAKLNLANAGVGSASHLCELLLQSQLKSNMTLVPYRGTGPAMTDLIGGQVDLMCEQATNSVPQIAAKSVKVYGVSSTQRMRNLPALKDVPTLDEAGLTGFNFTVWHALYAPHGTPKPVLDKINAALRTALKNADFIKRQEAVGITVVTDDRLSPEGHKKYFESELARWSKVIKDAGIQPE
jgi:tripartite-type tricarboxylate transporter receptor subunit TctC